MFLSLSELIRKIAAVNIPEDWKQWKKDVTEKSPKTEPETKKLLKNKADQIRGNIVTKKIKEPQYFLRDINKIITYLTNNVKDPKKQGLSQELSNYTNDVIPKIKKNSPVELSSEDQKSFIDKAENLEDEGTLLTLFSNLFNEEYQDKKRVRSSIMGTLLDVAKTISKQ